MSVIVVCFRWRSVEIDYISEREKLYTHYINRASWAGARIIQEQWTPFAADIFDLLVLVFSKDGKLVDLNQLKAASTVSEEEWTWLMQYTTQVYFFVALAGLL